MSSPFLLYPKQFPKPLDFATMDLTHLSFVVIGAIPQVETYKILVLDWALDVKKPGVTISNIKLLEFLQK